MDRLVKGAIVGLVEPFPLHVGRGNPGAKVSVGRELISVGGEGFQGDASGGAPVDLVMGGRLLHEKVPSAALGAEGRDHNHTVLSDSGAVSCGDVGERCS